jgi:hypothetical protein
MWSLRRFKLLMGWGRVVENFLCIYLPSLWLIDEHFADECKWLVQAASVERHRLRKEDAHHCGSPHSANAQAIIIPVRNVIVPPENGKKKRPTARNG